MAWDKQGNTAGLYTWQFARLAADDTNTTTAQQTAASLTLPGAGTYRYEFYGNYQQSANSYGLRLGLLLTGTISAFNALEENYTGPAASSTSSAQAITSGTPLILGVATIGPGAGVDRWFQVRGTMVLGGSSFFTLSHAPSAAGTTTIRAGALLAVQRIG